MIVIHTYVDASEQLMLEWYVRDLQTSRAFYQQWGFAVTRDEGEFIEFTWDTVRFALKALPEAPLPTAHPAGTLRVMVPNVDDYWALAQQLGARVLWPIENRSYGVRDFTVAGPDGLGLCFATRLSDLQAPSRP
jgi:hypothetical protein